MNKNFHSAGYLHFHKQIVHVKFHLLLKNCTLPFLLCYGITQATKAAGARFSAVPLPLSLFLKPREGRESSLHSTLGTTRNSRKDCLTRFWNQRTLAILTSIQTFSKAHRTSFVMKKTLFGI